MPDEKQTFFDKHWEKLLTMVAIPLLMWVANNYEEKGYMKAKLEINEKLNEVLDENLDLNDDLDECLNGSR